MGSVVLDWLVVGGGVHGTVISAFLQARGARSNTRVAVADRFEEPLAAWKARVRNVGMDFLRSPSVHHLDLDPGSLTGFATSQRSGSFRGPYGRPSVALFDAHCAATLEGRGLHALRVRAEVKGLARRSQSGFVVETDQGALAARRVVLAVGRERLRWPPWAHRLREQGGQVDHILDPSFDRTRVHEGRIAVLGGGISAAQAALSLSRQIGEAGNVVLVRRHDERIHEFDSDPGWLGPRHLAGFHRERDWRRRRRAIRGARASGSMPGDVAGELREAVEESAVSLCEADVVSASRMPGGVALALDRGAEDLCVDRVVLATGFHPDRPGGPWVARAIEEIGLPCAPCGYPVVDRRLEWAPGLYAAGPLAELELGPAAPNIAGARMAAARLVGG